MRSSCLELAVADELVLEVLHAVGQVDPLAPDRLVAVGDLVEQRSTARGCSRQAAPEPDVADLDG